MSHGIMKPIGATALILTVISLLAVSSSNDSNPGTSPEPSSNTYKTEPPLKRAEPADSGNEAITTSPTTPSTTKAGNAGSSTSPPNVTAPGSTESQTHATPDSSTKVGNDSAVNSSAIASTTSGASVNDTLPSPGISSFAEPTEAKHLDEATTSRDNVVPSSAASPPEKTTTGSKEQGFTAQPDKNQISGQDKGTPKSHKGVIVPVVVCVVAGIAIVLLVFLYKMCQKKPAVPERLEEVKPTDQTKENVKLLSVKTSPPSSDAKRAASSQMESIEC